MSDQRWLTVATMPASKTRAGAGPMPIRTNPAFPDAVVE
jgi:hypothetical protein